MQIDHASTPVNNLPAQLTLKQRLNLSHFRRRKPLLQSLHVARSIVLRWREPSRHHAGGDLYLADLVDQLGLDAQAGGRKSGNQIVNVPVGQRIVLRRVDGFLRIANFFHQAGVNIRPIDQRIEPLCLARDAFAQTDDALGA